MWNFITLDGYFEGDKNWDLPFHEIVWGPELEKISIDQLKAAGYLVFGRVTYEGMAAYWKTEKGEIAELMNKIPKLVCSRTLNSLDWNNSTLVRGDTSVEISKLKAQCGGDMYVFGSANLSGLLLTTIYLTNIALELHLLLLVAEDHCFKTA
jgi:dihydrofolate reductase